MCVVKGTTLGKRDTTLTHRHTFSRKIIPATDKRIDEEGMSSLKPRMKKVGGTFMSDECQSTTNQPVINVILDVDGMLSLRLATDCSGSDKKMTFICDLLCKVIDEKDFWSVMEDFSKSPGLSVMSGLSGK
jgi:BRCT domain type II-containing protein